MKTHFISFLLLIGMSLGVSSQLYAQPSYQPSEENLKAREEFQDNKFGIFLHWGLYAIPGGEWNGKMYGGAAEWLKSWAKSLVFFFIGGYMPCSLPVSGL